MSRLTDKPRLSPKDISEITGIDSSRPVAQRNRLRRMGIKAELNARGEVVCFWSWVDAAGLSSEMLSRLFDVIKAVVKGGDYEDDDIGLNLSALDEKVSML